MVSLLLGATLFQTAALNVIADKIDTSIDVLHYEFTIELPDRGAQFDATARLTVLRLRASPVLRLNLDGAMTVSAAEVNGVPLAPDRWRQQADTLILALGDGVGDTVAVRLSYAGTPKRGLRIGTNVHGHPVAFADNWPNHARAWLPTHDHPSDKASVTWHIAVPAGWQAIANGAPAGVDTIPGGTGRTVWHWDESRPIPVHTMVIGAGAFAIGLVDSSSAVPHALWTYPEDSAFAATKPFARVQTMLDVLTAFIGPFPYDKLVHVESTTRFGAMENSSAIFYNQAAYAERRLGEGTVAHETAHQWFGDAVAQRDWHHLWLSEGLSTYMAALFYDLIGERERFHERLRDARDSYLASEDVAVAILDTSEVDPGELLTANHYDKGALVMHMLRREVGDTTFRGIVREYYRRYRDSTALSGDLAAIASELAGRDLTWFFEQWLTQPGYPVLDVAWRPVAGTDSVELTVREVQRPEWGRYVLSVPVTVVGSGERLTTVRLTNGVVIRVPAPQAPTEILLDPEGDLLAEFRVRRGG